jgi:hypothetical protein
MPLETVFAIFNYGILAPWLLLAIAPRWSVTQKVVHSAIGPLALAVAYVLLLTTDRPGPQSGSFFSLDGVMHIFTSRQTVIAAWIHYLVGDLFLGAWEVRDAQRLGIPHWAVLPCLLLTLMFGPVGLASFLILRLVWKKRLTLVEA